MPGTHYYEILRWPVVAFVELFNIPDFAEVAQNPVVVTTQTLKPNWFQSGFAFYQAFDPRHFMLTLSTLGSLGKSGDWKHRTHKVTVLIKYN